VALKLVEKKPVDFSSAGFYEKRLKSKLLHPQQLAVVIIEFWFSFRFFRPVDESGDYRGQQHEADDKSDLGKLDQVH
jgi:hypothetical protein